ncbi:MAG TPA: flagellar biosynthesis protein FlhA [Phycisphaerales bacterium]|nr:flagellar biosynthesis protein FlhA [Phycisphaerales bacterium]
MASESSNPNPPELVLPAWIANFTKYRALVVPIGFMLGLMVILVPLPPMAMDLLISLNISLGVVILLTTIYMKHPLDFSVFPSLLLATTLFRLVLNIASTRLILTADAATPEAATNVAGKVIGAFGAFVAGDSLAVGVIIFLILVIVQFVVITKGATRISEVAARFTLDAMPGKQLAIDADLNAGIITEDEARERREMIRREADFFGAMDGSSKFVRGDAVAGILITMINVAGGFAIGTLERGWPAGQTAAVFTKLTIGDGLTSALPSFVISIAAALIVTRSGAKADLGTEITGQLGSQPRGLFMTSAFLLLLAATPLPTVPLIASSAMISLIGYGILRGTKVAEQEAEEQIAQDQQVEPPPIETLLKIDTLELEVGYGLVQLVDTNQGGDLLERISSTRRQLALELGLVMPPVRIRDNMQLEPTQYRVKIRGATVAEGSVEPAYLMAMDPGLASGPIEGLPTKEPAFGLQAWWIDPSLKHRAETLNYTVVEPSSVLATHLSEVIKRHADELLTRDEVGNLIEQLKEQSARLVEETIPAIVTTSDLQKVLQTLLRERVSIRDLESILETLADWAPKTKDVAVQTEYVRNSLKRWISQQYATMTPEGVLKLYCVTLDPALEERVQGYIDRSGDTTVVTMPPRAATELAGRVLESLSSLTAAGHAPIVLASPAVRGVMHQILEPHVPGVTVLGYNEIVQGVEVESMGFVTWPEASEAGTAGEAVGAGSAA